MKTLLKIIIALSLASSSILAQFDDSNWEIVYQENFDSNFTAIDGQTFSTDNWLIFQLINGGAITIENGYAQLNADDFENAALIRSTHILPTEYKIRTKIGYINYDLANYEDSDFINPNFNTHGGNYENGMYFLTVTDDTCIADECAEQWWHYHRKMVIDIDNHINSGVGETFHPIYMVYMDSLTNAGGNLLRTWTGTFWDSTTWNWNVAATYDYNSWYYAELEKYNGFLTLRLYDGNKNIIEEPTPINLSLVNEMDNPIEYLYVGEPHTDDYEGNVRIDEITLLTYDSVTVDIGETINELPTKFLLSQNYPNPFNPSTTIAYALPTQTDVTIEIFNIMGQKVKSLVHKTQSAGRHQIKWDGKNANGQNLSSGIYLYKLTTDNFTSSNKMLLLK